ncbi:hypothetical protein F5Y09DRAFT_354969 [Xylaria sp. FL1042]|nr:hypothetical protein F5Y09DRAFT_354969 [Xylaria sp. FL1042]
MRAFLPAPLLFVLLLQTGSSSAVGNDFSAYPEESQSCLYSSADDAGCSSGSTGADLNNCLCKNKNNFIYNTAGCVAKESPSDLDAVYETLSSNCAGTGVTLSVSKKAFLAAAAAATQTTSTPSPTSTSTSTTPRPTNASSTNNELSTGTKIGIGLGVGFGVIAAALAAWFIWAYQRRRRSAQSVHSNEVPSGGAESSSYDGAGAFTMTNESRHEYAQDNTQQGAAELAPVAWKPPATYTTPSYTENKNGVTAGVPLLAEMGTESEAKQKAVELPAAPGYLGYSDRAPENVNEPVTPEGLSPATYSQSGRSDQSPYTPSRCSEVGTFRQSSG